MVTRPFMLGMLCLATACGGSVERAWTCRMDDRLFPKEWFVGETVVVGDEPTLALTITVTGASFQPQPATLVGASLSLSVTAEVTESFLLLRDVQGDVYSAFRVQSHRTTSCEVPYDPNMPVTDPDPFPMPETPWFERGWFWVDWSSDLAGPDRYAFDAAAEAGYDDAVEYTPVTYSVEGLREDLADDQIALVAKSLVTWNAIDETTPGCAFDLPDLAPDEPCPTGEIDLVYELRR